MTKSNSGTIVLPAGLGSNLLLFFTDIYHLSFNLLYEEHPFLCGVQETVLLVLFFTFSTLVFYLTKYYSFCDGHPAQQCAVAAAMVPGRNPAATGHQRSLPLMTNRDLLKNTRQGMAPQYTTWHRAIHHYVYV